MSRGFTLIELLLGILLLGGVILAFLGVNTFSARGAMDSYIESLAYQLAREPIEVLSGFGYAWVASQEPTLSKNDPPFCYRFGNWQDLGATTAPGVFPRMYYPAEAANFQRRVTLARVDGENRPGALGAFEIMVEVRPRPGTPMDALLSQDSVVLRKTLVGRQ